MASLVTDLLDPFDAAVAGRLDELWLILIDMCLDGSKTVEQHLVDRW